MANVVPRRVTSVLVEEDANSVTITWGIAEAVDTKPVEYFGYGMYYYDPTGNGGKRFGVRFGEATTAWVFDNASNTQANYASDSVTVSSNAIVVRYHDASLGIEDIGTISAYAHINGRDEQVELPVTLLR
ncbi:hypothetical protein ACL9RL_02605 [Plantibacter sp. Mn2098]|uniref:hypothetical protein n=1 Tax=Plantibacter sp. Mn2098 TaxID=3395266 RepID=UPI003BD38D96